MPAGNPFDQFDTATSSNPFDQFDEKPATRGFLGASAESGARSLLSTGARVLDALNPFTTSDEEAATLFKDDPEGFKQFQERSAAGALSRFAREQAKRADEVMSRVNPGQTGAVSGKPLGELEYATLDPDKAAYLAPTRVAGDVLRSLPSTLALAVATYLTRGRATTAAEQAEKAALASGANPVAAQAAGREAAIAAGAETMAKAGAIGEGAVGAGQGYDEALDKAMKTPAETYEQAPEYQQLIAQGYEPQMARIALAHKVAREAATGAGVVDAATNAAGGAVLGRIVGEGGKLGARVAKGALTEAATETVQSAGEQVAGNLAQRAVDPGQSLSQGVGEAAAAGGVVGGVTGGAFAGALGRPDQSARRKQLERTMAESQSVDEISAAALELTELGPEIDTALKAYLPTMPQTTSPAPETVAPTQQFEDLTPMTKLQATQRLAVVQDQNTISGREFAVVPHPSAKKAFAIERSDLPMTEVNPPVPELAGPAKPLAEERAAAPLASTVVAAERTTPFQRTAVDKAVLNSADAQLSAEDRALVSKAARGPFALSLEDRNRLKELNGGVKMSPVRDIVRTTLKDESADIVDPGILPAAASIPLSQRGAALSREVHGLMTRVAKTFGKNVVVFRGNGPDGFVRADQPDTIYVSETASKPHMVILGHEITHQMKAQLGNAYTAFESVVKRNLSREGAEAFEKDYGAGADIEELSSDLMGNRFQEPEFWEDVFKQIDANLGRKAAIGVVQRLGNLISKAVAAAKKVAGNLAGFKADEMINNLDAVRAAAKKALAQYAVNRREAMEQANGPDQQRSEAAGAAGLAAEAARREAAPEGRAGTEARRSPAREAEDLSADSLTRRTQSGNDRTRIENNASGESEASVEAQSRLRDETAKGRHRLLVDRDGTVRPLVTADRVDQRVYSGQVIVQRGVGRDEWTVLDAGPGANKARAIERAKSWSPTPVRVEQAETLDQMDSDFSLDDFVPSKWSPARIDAEAAKADKNPSAAQIEADNYEKGHIRVDGLEISIETAKGTIRRSKPGAKPVWAVEMPAHYGDIKGYKGADGDDVDISIGDAGGNHRYWIIDQTKPNSDAFDEHKVVTGVTSKAEAQSLYLRGFADNFGEKIFDGISDELGPEELKAALPGLAKPVRFSPKRKPSEELPQIADKDRAALTRAAANLTPSERAKLRTDTAQRMVDLIRELPSANEIAAVAFAGRAKRGWYKDSAEAIANVFGPDAPRFAGLLAAMSPQTSVENNLTNALNTWKNWVAAGRPQSREEIIQVMGRSVMGNKGVDSVLDAWVNNSVRALTAEGKIVLSGPKVNSFMENLIGNVEEVTNDAWMSNFALVDQTIFSGSLNKAGTEPGKTPGYLAMNAQIRAAAKELTKRTGVEWTPSEVQETVWSWAKALYESQKDGITATDILYNEELTDDLIRSTPDFRTLFNTPANERILDKAGLGDQVRRLRDAGPGADAVAKDAGQAEPFDSATQARYEVNAAKRLERLKEEGDAAKVKLSPARQTETPEFKKWFGDSKVTDKDGKPLVVYHGTTKSFDEFKTKGDGAFFSTAKVASSYASFGEAVGANVVPVYLSIQNPLIVDAPGGRMIAANYYDLMAEDLQEQARGEGRDGVIVREKRGRQDNSTYIAFRPEQIKSAIGNRGTFDANDPDIRRSPKRTLVNIGLNVNDGSKLTDDEALQALRDQGADILDFIKHTSDTEPTLVVTLASPLTAKQADAVSEHLRQDAIAQMTGDEGELYGPRADEWKPFNPDYFLLPNGKRASADVKASPKREIVGASKRAYTPEQKRMFGHVGREIDVPTVKDRIVALRKDLGKKLAQGVADQFAPVKELTQKGYNLMRLSKGSAGAVEAFLHHGKLKLRDGAYDADQTGGFIERLGVPLQGELEDFLWWVAANRAERLSAEDRENLFSAADIEAGKSLASGTTDFVYVKQDGTRTSSREAIYRDALKVFEEFNKNAMDMAEQSGLIDPEARKIWENQFYVPFYRVSDDDRGFVGGNVKSGVVRQRAFKALKGGTNKLNSDLLANTLQNWAHLIDASAKNRAAEATLEAAVNAGIAVEADAETVRQMAKSAGARNSIVWFMDSGKERHFLIEDPYILTALNGLEFAGLRGPLMDALSSFKHWLTIGVTASPAFKIRNLIRDSMQAIAVSGLSYNPITNVVKGFKASDRDTQQYVSALASGALIRFGTMLEGKASDQVRQLVRMGVDKSTILDSDEKIKHVTRQFEKAFMAYSEIGNRGEEINRSALFQTLEEQGFSRAEAAVAARDLLDFSMQGAWTSVRFLTQVVPFMNARIQGLYKLGRAAKEDPKRFSIVLGAVALTSLALMAMYHDDDDWKKREDWDRDNYWWFKLSGVAYRIPKPFEIGALATLAERGVELFTDKEMTPERFLTRVKHIIGDNLAMNPIPQAVKPILDVYANQDSFTGRPIETMGMEKKRPDYRFTQNTSMPARAVSTAGQKAADLIGGDFLSPVQVDHLVRGYLGWLGSFAVGGADMAIRPLTGEPTRATTDYYKLATQGFVAEVPDRNSRYVTALYEQSKRLDQAYSTWRGLIKDGKVAEAREYLEDNREEIVKSRQFDRVKRAEAAVNEQIRVIERSALDPDEKKARIARLNAQKDRIARSVTQPR